jgi:protein TonB
MRWPELTTLQWALALSLGAHGVLLSVRFVDPEAIERAFRDTPLEVILVNARGEDPPAEAQGRATSPLPLAATVQLGESPDEARQRIAQLRRQQQQLQRQQQLLLAQARREIAALLSPDPSRDNGSPEQREQEERRKQLLRMLSEIEKRVNEENARPKKRYVSPATREEIYALYYDNLRRRIEDRGTRSFPEHQGRKLFGELTMNVTIDAAGRVVEADIVRSSNDRRLDQQALAIVAASQPFGPFTPAMRARADQIVVTSRFRFTRDEALETIQLSR